MFVTWIGVVLCVLAVLGAATSPQVVPEIGPAASGELDNGHGGETLGDPRQIAEAHLRDVAVWDMIREVCGRVGERSREVGSAARDKSVRLTGAAGEAVQAVGGRLGAAGAVAAKKSRDGIVQAAGRFGVTGERNGVSAQERGAVGGCPGQAENCSVPSVNGAVPKEAFAHEFPVAVADAPRAGGSGGEGRKSGSDDAGGPGGLPWEFSHLPWWLMYAAMKLAARTGWSALRYASWVAWNLLSWALLCLVIWVLARMARDAGAAVLAAEALAVLGRGLQAARAWRRPGEGSGVCYRLLFKPGERARVVGVLGRLPALSDVLALLTEDTYQPGSYSVEMSHPVAHVREGEGLVWSFEQCYGLLTALADGHPGLKLGEPPHRGRFNKQHLGSMRRVASHLGMHSPCCAWTDSDFEWCDAEEVPTLRYAALFRDEVLAVVKACLGFSPTAADVVAYLIREPGHFARGVARLVLVDDGEVAAVRVPYGCGLATRTRFFWALLTKFGWPREMVWFGEPLLASGFTPGECAQVAALCAGSGAFGEDEPVSSTAVAIPGVSD